MSEEATDVSGGEGSGSGRRRLMTAAGRLFVTNGINEVTVAQILEQSGVKAPTLYHHFGGKEGLYVAWVCHALDVIEAEFRALDAGGASLRDFLLESARILLSQRSMDFMQVLRDRRWLADPDSLDQVNDALRAAVFQPIARALETQTSVREPKDASQLFVHMVSLRRPHYRRSDSVGECTNEEIVDLFLSGAMAGGRHPEPQRDGQPARAVEVK